LLNKNGEAIVGLIVIKLENPSFPLFEPCGCDVELANKFKAKPLLFWLKLN
jgi:hypothetical protein